jgi:hypothetical protein
VEDVEVFDSKNPANPCTMFRANFSVLDGGATGVQAGTGGAFLEQLNGHKFPSHKTAALALIKLLIGALFGYADKDQIQAYVTSAVMANVTSAANPLRGHVFGARVTNVTTKSGKVIAKYENVRPVLGPDGKPKRVDLGVTDAPSTPAAAPPAPPAPGGVFPPAGWTLHPTSPGYYYRGQEVLTEAQLRARF